VDPPYFDASLRLRGNVWIDALGWSTFDHGVAGSEARFADPTCITNDTLPTCPLTGYLWSANAGWFRFSGNNGAPDVEYVKSTMSLSGSIWNNQVGWVELTGINTVLGPMIFNIPGGTYKGSGSYVLAATGGVNLTLNLSPSSLALLAASALPTTIKVCHTSLPAMCQEWPFNLITGSSPLFDFSMAGVYNYMLLDSF
jgi:hypothetical protein